MPHQHQDQGGLEQYKLPRAGWPPPGCLISVSLAGPTRSHGRAQGQSLRSQMVFRYRLGGWALVTKHAGDTDTQAFSVKTTERFWGEDTTHLCSFTFSHAQSMRCCSQAWVSVTFIAKLPLIVSSDQKVIQQETYCIKQYNAPCPQPTSKQMKENHS